MDNTKYYIWVSTTIIITVTLFATGHWFFALVGLFLSYLFWVMI